ncbi:unnamed protein product [Prunus armeniaca]
MELWTYRHSLIVLKSVTKHGSLHTMPLTHGTFWVQPHGVPGFYMTMKVAKAIGETLGEVFQVDNRDGEDCVFESVLIKEWKTHLGCTESLYNSLFGSGRGDKLASTAAYVHHSRGDAYWWPKLPSDPTKLGTRSDRSPSLEVTDLVDTASSPYRTR